MKKKVKITKFAIVYINGKWKYIHEKKIFTDLKFTSF